MSQMQNAISWIICNVLILHDQKYADIVHFINGTAKKHKYLFLEYQQYTILNCNLNMRIEAIQLKLNIFVCWSQLAQPLKEFVHKGHVTIIP